MNHCLKMNIINIHQLVSMRIADTMTYQRFYIIRGIRSLNVCSLRYRISLSVVTNYYYSRSNYPHFLQIFIENVPYWRIYAKDIDIFTLLQIHFVWVDLDFISCRVKFLSCHDNIFKLPVLLFHVMVIAMNDSLVSYEFVVTPADYIITCLR